MRDTIEWPAFAYVTFSMMCNGYIPRFLKVSAGHITWSKNLGYSWTLRLTFSQSLGSPIYGNGLLQYEIK